MEKKFGVMVFIVLMLAACESDTATGPTDAGDEANWQTPAMPQPQTLWAEGDTRIAVSLDGDLLLGDQVLQQGNFETLDGRRQEDGSVRLVSVDRSRNEAVLFALQDNGLTELQRIPAPAYQINGLCLYRDRQSLLSVFLLDERGGADQWLLDDDRQPRKLRHLVMPPDAEFCAVDDARAALYVSEETVGLWRYQADPEQDPERELLDLLAPRGNIRESAGGLAVIPGGVALLDKEAGDLHLYRFDDDQHHRYAVPELDEPERLAASHDGEALNLYAVDDGDHGVRRLDLAWQADPAVTDIMTMVEPSAQTDTVALFGDAADDPAIWLNRQIPSASRILGTDKKAGLHVYGLDGKETQFLAAGRLNNVDVRYDVDVAGRRHDIAVATNRDHNSLHLFLIDPLTGVLEDTGQIATGLDEIYGLCLYQDEQGLYAFPNGKSGAIEQWLLQAEGDDFQGSLVRKLKVASQPEGCVADDDSGRLFVGEEDNAVWVFPAAADQPADAQQVVAVSERLHADIEGLALYRKGGQHFLVISSQGNNSFVLVDAEPPYRWRGRFRIGMNVAQGIDGVSETDGLEVTSANLGGPYTEGLLVVQDGRNRLPQAPQNFKLVPWTAIDHALQLSEQGNGHE